MSSDLQNVSISRLKLDIFNVFNLIRKLLTDNFCESLSKIYFMGMGIL